MFSKNQSYNWQCFVDIHTLVSCNTSHQTMQRCVSCNGVHCFRASGSLYVSFISRVLPVLPMSLYCSMDWYCSPVNVCWLRFTIKYAGIPSRQTNNCMDTIHTHASYQPPWTLSNSPMSNYLKMRSVDGTLQYWSLLLIT